MPRLLISRYGSHFASSTSGLSAAQCCGRFCWWWLRLKCVLAMKAPSLTAARTVAVVQMLPRDSGVIGSSGSLLLLAVTEKLRSTAAWRMPA
jgi:hypothetical protein